MDSDKKTISIRVTVLGVFIAVAGLTAGLVLGLQYYFSRDLAKIAAEDAFRITSEKVGERIQGLDSQSANLVEVLGRFYELEKFPGPGRESRSLPLLAGGINQNADLYAIYVGYDTGDFFELVNLESSDYVRNAYLAAPNDRWVVVKVETAGGNRQKTISYLDSGFNVRDKREEITDYDPRNRPWFKKATASPGIIKTEPYIFANLSSPGVTYAKSINGGQRVVALDISLAGLSGFLQKQRVLPHTQAFLFDKKGDIIARTLEKQASDTYGTVPDNRLQDIASTAGTKGRLQPITIRGKDYLGYVARVETVYGTEEFLGLLVPVQETLRPYMEKIRFSLLVTLGLLSLLAPIVWYCATIIVKPINALALESEKVRLRKYTEVGTVKSNITEIIGLSRSMVTMASAIRAHEESLKELMDSFIKLIATAIDQKSPYTGGHCARVPELSVMLAKAAEDCTEGPLEGFSFNTEDERHEFKTAAWLHDCGKMVTPEYIVDKATKLETIYNRIHEIRMRFEVLLRDAEIEYWKELSRGGDEPALARTLAAKQQEIREEFSFIARCNLGGEFMPEDSIRRVRQIARKTWTRNLDDRLGLGQTELERYTEKAPALPCEEPLLADRPEHYIKRPEETALGNTDGRFAMEVPDLLYNLGEIYNLSISRGTLTAEDRYKIKEHITTTIQMLETLPYPENMTRIPEYAGAHHETLIGTGYPRKLTAEKIGIPARIMALSDVFEALTASDRPYKKAKTLNEAVRILSFMVRDKHLDPGIFKLFLESGVYMEYAERFLDPSQIDDVDVAGYVAETG